MSEVGEIYDIVLGLCIYNSLDRAIVLNVQQVPFRQLSRRGERLEPVSLRRKFRGEVAICSVIRQIRYLAGRRASGTHQGTRSLLQACSSALESRWAMGCLLAGALLRALA